jgi:hypothetical protein
VILVLVLYYPLGRRVVDDFACRDTPTCLTCRAYQGCDLTGSAPRLLP